MHDMTSYAILPVDPRTNDSCEGLGKFIFVPQAFDIEISGTSVWMRKYQVTGGIPALAADKIQDSGNVYSLKLHFIFLHILHML